MTSQEEPDVHDLDREIVSDGGSDHVAMIDGSVSSIDIPEDTTAKTVDVEPEYGSATVSVSGANNVVAFGNVDQSSDKTIISGNPNVFFGCGIGASEHESAALRRNPEGRNAEALRNLSENYIAPPGLLEQDDNSAFTILCRRRVLVLTAPVNDGGQLSAALRLADELARQYDANLWARDEQVDEEFVFDSALLRDAVTNALILDLRDTSASKVNQIRKSVLGFVEEITRRDSYLILIAPVSREHELIQEFPGHIHELARAPAREVFLHHVERGVPDATTVADQPEVAQLLAGAWPPRAETIARWVSEAAKSGITEADSLAREAHHIAEDWSSELRGHIERHQKNNDVEWISLLLATAILEAAPAQEIVTASDLLLSPACSRKKQDDVTPSHVLLRPGVVTTVSRLGDLALDSDCRVFAHPRFGVSTLRHFWTEHPTTHSALLEWIATIPSKVRLDRAALERFIHRVADFAVISSADVAIGLAVKWAKSGEKNPNTEKAASYRALAVRVVSTVALDPRIGHAVRKQLYEWAYQPSADAGQKMLVAEVCGGEFGTVFPRVALTRLKHLAESEQDIVREAAMWAMIRVCSAIGVRRFLWHLDEWFVESTPARLGTLAAGVEGAFDQLPEISENDIIPVIESFFGRVLSTMPMTESRRVTGAWLRAVVRSNTSVSKEKLVEPMISATESEPGRIGRLSCVTRLFLSRDGDAVDGFESEGSLEGVVQHLWTRLDEIDPYA